MAYQHDGVCEPKWSTTNGSVSQRRQRAPQNPPGNFAQLRRSRGTEFSGVTWRLYIERASELHSLALTPLNFLVSNSKPL